MCDCYQGRCVICNEPFPIHLEDFSTERKEIVILCKACAKKAIYTDKNRDEETGERVEVVFVCLTKNAIKHKGGNELNM